MAQGIPLGVAKVQMPYVWMQRVCSGSIPYVLSLYTEQAVLVPTYSRAILQGHRQLGAYFHDFMGKEGLCGTIDGLITQSIGEAQVYSGFYTFHWTEQGVPKKVGARFTYVVVPTANGPRILTHHSSEVPNV